MTNTPLARQGVAAFVLFLSLFAFNVQNASATHFLGGQVTWRVDPTFVGSPTQKRIIITFEASWRRDFAWTPANPAFGQQIQSPLYTITATTATGVATNFSLPMFVDSVNVAENWFHGAYEFAVVYNAADFPVSLVHTSGDRHSELLEGNHDKLWRLETTIDPSKGTQSPRSTMVPRLYVERDLLFSMLVPNTAFDGFTNTFSFASPAESSLVQIRPIGNSACTANGVGMCTQCNTDMTTGVCSQGLNLSPTGAMSWTPHTEGLYALQLKITSRDALGVAKNSTPLDFIIKVLPPCPTCPRPVVQVPQPAYTVSIGHSLSIPITVIEPNAPPGTTITLANTPLPAGASLAILNNPATPPLQAVLNWTPTQAQVGNHVVCFQATDSPGLRTSIGQVCTTINVIANQPTSITCTPTMTVQGTGSITNVVMSWPFSNPDQDQLTADFYYGGVHYGSPVQIAPSLGGIVQYSFPFGFGDNVVRLQLSDGFTAPTACETVVTVSRIAQTIAFAPPATIAFGPGSYPLTPSSSSGLPVTLQVLSGPGSLSGGPGPYTLIATGVGDIEIKATQDGNSTFAPADPVMRFVHVIDVTAPLIQHHDGETHEAASSQGAVVNYTPPDYTDDVDQAGAASCLPASGSTFALGQTQVTCTASDAAENTATSTFMVKVVDTTPPSIDAHADVPPVPAIGVSGAPVTYTSPTASDLVDGTVAVNCGPASGLTFAIGVSTVTCTATDARANSSSSTFAVTVTNNAPTFTPPGDISTPATGAGGAQVSFTAEGDDVEQDTIAAFCTPASGSTFIIGTTQVNCTVTDSYEASVSGSFFVTVTNNAPSISVPGNIVAEATSSAGAVVAFSASGSDIEDGTLSAQCTPPAGPFGLGTTPVSCTVTDGRGASASAGFSVTVQDTTPPVVAYSGNAGAYSLNQTVNITCTATDAVGVVSSTCANIAGPAYSFAASNSFTATATDAAGHTGSATTSFTVTATLQDLMGLVNQFCTNPGVANGLNAKLQAAAAANNANARRGQLGAFENQVRSQIGKTLTSQQAALLLQLVQQLY